MKKKPEISPSDFAESCNRAFREPDVEAGIIEPFTAPPPSPEVQAIIDGLLEGAKKAFVVHQGTRLKP